MKLSINQSSLLMISYPFPPNPSAGAVRSERFSRYLSEYGWDIDVITIKPQQARSVSDSELFGEKITVHRTQTFDPWLRLSKRVPKNFILRVIRSVLMRIFSFPDHMLLWLPFAVFQGLKICKQKKIDAIYTTSPPHSSQIIGYLLAKITGIPLVADFRDPWTLNAYRDTGVIDTILFKFSAVIERTVYRQASFVLANTRANRINLLNAFPEIDHHKVVYLPNGWESFEMEGTEPLSQNDSFTIVHTGTFYPKFNPYALLYAIGMWKNGLQPKNIPDLHDRDLKVLLFGSKDAETRHLIGHLDIEKYVEIIPWVPQVEARNMMCAADLLWVTLGTGPESSTYVPSKLFEYIAAKKPIIGFFPDGEASDIIKKTNTGKVFSDDNSQPVIEFLYECMRLKKESSGYDFIPDEQVIQAYNVKIITERLSELLMSL